MQTKFYHQHLWAHLEMIAASDILANPPELYRIIPLGSDCFVTHQLRARNLRFEALPFDWNVTPIQSVISLLESNFVVFLSFKNLVFLPSCRKLFFKEDGLDTELTNEIVTPVVCRKHRMLFPYDFSAAGKVVYEEVAQKYNRRISRFRELCNSCLSILFVGHNGQLNEWQQKQFHYCFDTRWQNHFGGWRQIFGATITAQYPKLQFGLCDSDTLMDLLV